MLKLSRRQFDVFDRVLDVAISQEELDRPRILLSVGELKAAAMPELMVMHREPEFGDFSRVGDHLAHA